MLGNPYLYLSLVALCAKIWCGHRLRANWANSPAAIICFAFLLLQYTQTVLEIYVCYAIAYPGQDMLFILKLYYALFTSSLLFIPVLIYSVSHSRYNLWALSVTVLLMLVVSIVTVGTDHIVADAKLMQYTMTRVAGKYYGIFQLLSFAAMFVALAVALLGYYRSKPEIDRVKSINFFAGYLPYVLFIVTVIVLMATTNVKINAAGLSPLIMSIFLLVLSENIKLGEVGDCRIYFFWTKKARRIREVTHALRYVSQSPDHAKDMFEKYNTTLLETAEETFRFLEHGRGKQKRMAEWLGVTESKMSRIKSRKTG